MYTVAWSYRVAAGREAAFEALYGASGAWCRLFAASPAYLGTRLLRDAGEPREYVTLDRWRTRADYEAFLQDNREAYAQIDRAGDALTESEARLGSFESE
ncbi:antibiotic biosynthesis monooxygenase family protein [Cognatiluteimonas telluris]|uniref:antibiotic biosynthesis monooxygenase family protein n=1 Tax=Cognatiluteimonas telluris TaxID=1104775 RepID=UPI00140B7C7C|nr:antibiotic biosynthesis monooxygenase [Lysobacter telluris]